MDDIYQDAGVDTGGSRWSRFLGRILFLCSLLLFALAFTVSVDVTYRWFVGHSVTGVYEYSEVLLIALSFLAFAGVQASGRQLNVDILTAGVRGRRKKAALSLLDALAALVFFLVLAWSGILDFEEALRLDLMGNGVVQIPMAIPLGLVVLGSLMMLLTLLGQSRRALGTLLLGRGEEPSDSREAVAERNEESST